MPIQWHDQTESLEPAWILASTKGRVHKLAEKKERKTPIRGKNEGNLTHRVHKPKRWKPHKQGLPGIKKRGQIKSVPVCGGGWFTT